MQYNTFEQSNILGALLAYAEMGNPFSEEIRLILIQELEMHPFPAFVDLNKPPIIMWIHASIFMPGVGMVSNRPETAAIALYPAFEGEYYCTWNKADREPLRKATEDYLRTLEAPDFLLKKAIRERRLDLQETQKIYNNEFNSFFRIKALLSLCEKVMSTSYTEALKEFILLELNYQIYVLVKKGIHFENKSIADKMFNQLKASINHFLVAKGFSPAFYEVMMILSSAALHDRFRVTKDPDFQNQALNWFIILKTEINLTGLFKCPWMQELRLELFKFYYAYTCCQQDIPLDYNLKHAVHHLLQTERQYAGIFEWLNNAALLPKEISIFFDNSPLKKDLARQQALESEIARELYMTKLEQYISSHHPIDKGIEQLLVEFFKMDYIKLVQEQSVVVPVWVKRAIIKNNKLCIDSEETVGKIVLPNYLGETYLSIELLQAKTSSDTVYAAMIFQCNNYLLERVLQSYGAKNIENAVELSIAIREALFHLKKITLKRKQEFQKRNKVSLPTDEHIVYLLIFCDSIVEKIKITQGVLIFLLEIYYSIYCILEKSANESQHIHALTYGCMRSLKALLSISGDHVQHQEAVYILLCRILQTAKCLTVVNKKNQFDTVEAFFKNAIEHYSKHQSILFLPWVNDLRKSVLEYTLLKTFPNKMEYSMKDIASYLQDLGNKECHEWVTAQENAILPIVQRSKIELAIYYYSIILWMADVQLFVETPKKGNIKEYAKIKSMRLKEDLEKSKKEELILLLTPAVAYIEAQNPPTEAVKTFIHANSGILNEVELLLQKKHKTSIKQGLTDPEINFMVEIYEGMKIKPYDPLFKSIFKLDVLWQLYNRFSKFNDIINHNSILELSTQVENFIVEHAEKESIFFEIASILLFSIRFFSAKKHSLIAQIYTPESIALCFKNAFFDKHTVYFKAHWANSLRKDALLHYIIELSDFPAPKTCNTIKKVIGFLTAREVLNEHEAILRWMLNTNLVTKKQIEDNREKPKNRDIQCVEDAVLGFNDIVKDLKHSPFKPMAQEMRRVILSTSKKEQNEIKEKPKKQKDKIQTLPKETPILKPNLEEQAKLREQEQKNKIERDKETEAYRQTIAEQRQQTLDAQAALERQRASEEWRAKREEQAKLHALKESLNTSTPDQTTLKIREKLRLKKEKKEEENKRIMAQKEAELKAKQEEKDRLEALELEQKNLKREKKLAKQKIKREQEDLQLLQQYHLMMQQEKEKSINERPLRALRDFEIDEFTEAELPLENQRRIKELIKITKKHNLSEIQIYGSYIIFLANMRLNFPIEKLRRPGDLDLRIEIETKDFNEQLSFIQSLQTAGYILKGYSEKEAKTKGLAGYIAEKMPGGFLNLTLCVDKEDKETYEMELAILFKHYKANHNPFYLLSHCIKISNNQAAFDGCDIEARAQLAQDIINKQFNIIPAEILDPIQYNVFNFFPRLLKNIKAWKDNFLMNTESIQSFLTNLETIVNFFSTRFSYNKHKECYLELVGLITQNQFALPESKLIIKGFLMALFVAINVEAVLSLKKSIFALKEIEPNAQEITKTLQEKFATFICVIHGDQDINKIVFKRFYSSLMELLCEYAADDQLKTFITECQSRKGSVLYNTFKKYENINYVSHNAGIEMGGLVNASKKSMCI